MNYLQIKYKRCRPEKRLYRNLALGLLSFIICAAVLPVVNAPGIY